MDKEEAIKYLQQLYPNGGHCWLDEQRMEAIGMAVKALQEEPVSEDLEEAAIQFATDTETGKVDVVKQSSFFWGAIYHKQQMMAKAIDGVVTFDYYDSGDKTYGCVAHDSFCLENFGLKDRDKVKVIVIKED